MPTMLAMVTVIILQCPGHGGWDQPKQPPAKKKQCPGHGGKTFSTYQFGVALLSTTHSCLPFSLFSSPSLSFFSLSRSPRSPVKQDRRRSEAACLLVKQEKKQINNLQQGESLPSYKRNSYQWFVIRSSTARVP